MPFCGPNTRYQGIPGNDIFRQPDYPDEITSRIVLVRVIAILAGAILLTGCSTVQPDPSPPDGQQDPVVGLWISWESDTTTYYRFRENGTFTGWSHSGGAHPGKRTSTAGGGSPVERKHTPPKARTLDTAT